MSCTGNSESTTCRLQCKAGYVGVEEEVYRCRDMPCRAWATEGRTCYICSQECSHLGSEDTVTPSRLLGSLGCDPDCTSMVVTSKGGAAVWQNKRTGLFKFLGEHNGRPVYQNNATKEYLYYTFTGAEWLVGPDFRKPHAGETV